MWMELRHEFTIKKVKEANGDELFEKILWGIVLVVVRRHGASESAARSNHHTAPNTAQYGCRPTMTSFIPTHETLWRPELYAFPLLHYSDEQICYVFYLFFFMFCVLNGTLPSTICQSSSFEICVAKRGESFV